MTKYLLICLMTCLTIGLAGCDNRKEINGKIYDTYGVANEDVMKDPHIKYQLSPGSIIAAIIFSESIVIPVYIIGWDLYEPVGPKEAQSSTDYAPHAVNNSK